MCKKTIKIRKIGTNKVKKWQKRIEKHHSIKSVKNGHKGKVKKNRQKSDDKKQRQKVLPKMKVKKGKRGQ